MLNENALQYYYGWNKKIDPGINYDKFKIWFDKLYQSLQIPKEYLNNDIPTREYNGIFQKGISPKDDLRKNEEKIFNKIRELPKKYQNLIEKGLHQQRSENEFLYDIKFCNRFLELFFDNGKKTHCIIESYVGEDSFYENYSIYLENGNAILKFPEEIEEEKRFFENRLNLSDDECKEKHFEFFQRRILKLCRTLPYKTYDFMISSLEIDDEKIEPLEKKHGKLYLYEVEFRSNSLIMKYKNDAFCIQYSHSYHGEQYGKFIIKIEEDEMTYKSESIKFDNFKLTDAGKDYFNQLIQSQQFQYQIDSSSNGTSCLDKIWFEPNRTNVTFVGPSLSCIDCGKTNEPLTKDFVCNLCENIREFDKANKKK